MSEKGKIDGYNAKGKENVFGSSTGIEREE
jgi:hypothetical protein